MTKAHFKGIIMVIIGAALWGISGTVSQILFQDYHMPVGWLVDVRLLGSGFVLIIAGLIGKERQKIWQVWRSPRMMMSLFLFAIFGMVGVQYTYLASIALGNAAVATLLQYLAPVLIAFYFIIKKRAFPGWVEWIGIILAVLGTFLLLTNGSFQYLHIPTMAVLWGLLSALALSFYTIYPGSMLKKWGTSVVVGWGMLLGGLFLAVTNHPWEFGATHWNATAFAFTSFVILFGTLLAFYLYLASQRYITAKESSILACTEPLTAVLTAVLWLGVPMRIFQWIGAVCVLAMILLLAIKPEKKMADDDQSKVKLDSVS